ncbi:MAG TPA: EthD family reductase [Alphaproteobacteria bacterium]
MAVDYFIMFNGAGVDPIDFRDDYKRRNGAALRALPGVEAVLLHTPLPSHDPYLADKDPPLLLVQAKFTSAAAAEAALASPARARMQDDFGGLRVEGGRIAHETLRAEPYATATAAPSEIVTAPVSYFVHYRRPADDEKTFIEYYRAHHPSILAQFPGLRSLVLYLPMAWRNPSALADADHMLVCQVAFDSVEALNAALASEVRHRLREDYYTFPKFSGPVSHYAMLRDQVHP